MITRLRLLLSTVRHMSIQQMLYRVLRSLKRELIYPHFAKHLFPLDSAIRTAGNLPALATVDDALQMYDRVIITDEAARLLQREFTFLNKTHAPQHWHDSPGNDPLWQFTLHYWEWSHTLAIAFRLTGESRYRDGLISLLALYIEENPCPTGNAWHPYTISLRLIAWVRLHFFLHDDPTWLQFWQSTLVPVIFQQAKFLHANLEFDLMNNHLLANYRALAWVGMIFADTQAGATWQQVGISGLWQTMRHQVLPNGAHDERSISYHVLVLRDLLETVWLAKQYQLVIPDDVEPTLISMFDFLAAMQAPDGSFPMLNDSVPDYPCHPAEILLAGALHFDRNDWLPLYQHVNSIYAIGLCGKQSLPEQKSVFRSGSRLFPHAGLFIMHDKPDTLLIVDVGAMGPDHLPAHGHADALSVLLFAYGRWLLIDPGVYSYHDTQWRDVFRSTGFHNTLEIDAQDQCVFWGKFRVAYAPNTRIHQHDANSITASHDGYTRFKNGVQHQREVRQTARGTWQLHDTLTGSGHHSFVFNLHFHPDADVTLQGKGCVVVYDDVTLIVHPFNSPDDIKAQLVPGYYSDGWHQRRQCTRYQLAWTGNAPTLLDVELKLKV